MATPENGAQGANEARRSVARLALAHGKIDHDLARQPLERLAQVVELKALGDAQARLERETSRRR